MLLYLLDPQTWINIAVFIILANIYGYSEQRDMVAKSWSSEPGFTFSNLEILPSWWPQRKNTDKSCMNLLRLHLSNLGGKPSEK